MDKVVQKELIKKLYTNPLRKREKERRIKEMGSLEKEEPKEKVLFRTTQPILTNMNTYDYIDKLFNDNVNNSNIDNLLTDLEKIHVNTIKNQQTRKRKRNNNQENQENPIKKIKLELEKIQDEIKELEYIFHMGKSTPPTKKELKAKNVLRRKKEFAKTYKISIPDTY